ncbi:hypothetical protein KSP39_PZI021960 [Platanthera zijinensis]|uniref:Uncharacterized protein n=1 Tax=Platanthera zijinensis TaxID=2320716 RepID=A0AAP0FVU5_9ASPA
METPPPPLEMAPYRSSHSMAAGKCLLVLDFIKYVCSGGIEAELGDFSGSLAAVVVFAGDRNCCDSIQALHRLLWSCGALRTAAVVDLLSSSVKASIYGCENWLMELLD